MPSITTSSSVISLYIPIISKTTSEAYIKKMFESNKIGKIMRVDFVFNKAKERTEAFIHFDEWFDTQESKALKEDILDPNTKTWNLFPIVFCSPAYTNNCNIESV